MYFQYEVGADTASGPGTPTVGVPVAAATSDLDSDGTMRIGLVKPDPGAAAYGGTAPGTVAVHCIVAGV